MQIRSIHNRLFSIGALLALAPAAPLAAQTTNIPLVNAGFEAPVVADGATTGVGLNNWLVVGNLLSGLNAPLNETVLTFNPTDAQYPGTTGSNAIAGMDGSQIASFRTGPLNLIGGSATQATGPLLSLGVNYTLTVAVGNPLGSIFQGYTVSLLSGGTTLASVTSSDVNAVPDGTFKDVTVNYVLPGNLPNLLNTPLIVSIAAPDILSLGSPHGTDFDNVRLTATVIPEPGTMATVGLGLLGLVGAQYARRRRGVALRA